MKKIIFIFFLLVIAIFLYNTIQKKQANPATIKYTLQNKTYNLLTAKNPEEWKKGLMFVKKKDGFDGMIFSYPNKQYLTFWNKNTYVDLDVYWIDDEKVVGKSKLPSIEKSKDIVTVSSPQPINKVVEIIK